MSLIQKLEFPDAKFDLYFLAYNSANAISPNHKTFDREGVIELTHNYGTENDPDYKVNNGNVEPHRGFGHTCISVDNIQAACKRIEDAGYKFQKKLTEGRMRHIAFVLDPDGYWVEVVGQKPLEETENVTTTHVSTYRMVGCCSLPSKCVQVLTVPQNHTMIRVKDAEKSLKFYQDVLGMSLFRTSGNPAAGFTLYILGYPGIKGLPSEGGTTSDREGLLELTWNHGTEKHDNFSYHDGNKGPQGFGHICKVPSSFAAAYS